MITGPYQQIDPPRAEIDAIKGPLLLVFGRNDCGICQRTQPKLEAALAGQDWLQQIMIQDGQGHKLGRSFEVKLWPTLIFLLNGEELTRLVRPDSVGIIQVCFRQFGLTHP